MRRIFVVIGLLGILSACGDAASAQAIKVEIGVFGMDCSKVTNNEKALSNPADEVFFVVRGKTPAGNYTKRLPSDDGYYAFHKGEHGTNTKWKGVDDKQQTRPVFWAGSLEPGQTAEFIIQVAEQVNKDLKKNR